MLALYLCRLAWRFLSRSDLSVMSLHVGSSQRNTLFLIMDAWVTRDGLVTCPGSFSASIPAATGWEAEDDPDEESAEHGWVSALVSLTTLSSDLLLNYHAVWFQVARCAE